MADRSGPQRYDITQHEYLVLPVAMDTGED